MKTESQSSLDAESVEETGSKPPSIVNVLSDLKHNLTSVFTGSFELIALESRLAAVSLAWLLALGLLIAVALISVWALLMVALGLVLGSYGLAVEITLLMVAMVNIVFSLCLWFWVRKISRNLTFQASRQHLLASKGKGFSNNAQE